MSRPATGAALTLTVTGKHRTSVPLAAGKRRTADFDTVEQAEQWRAAALVAREIGQALPDPDQYRRPATETTAEADANCLFDEVYRQWWRERYPEHGGSTATRADAVNQRWDRHIRPWLTAFGLLTGSDVTREQVRALLAALAGRPHRLLKAFAPGADPAHDGITVTITEADRDHGFPRSTTRRWLHRKRLPGAAKDPDTGIWQIPLPELHWCRASRLGTPTWPPGRPYSDGVIKDVWWILESVLTFGATAGIDAWRLGFDPAAIRAPKTTQPKSVKPRMITIEEVARVARYLHPVHQLTLWVMVLLGLRISEAFGLHCRDLHHDKGRQFVKVRRMGGQAFAVFDADGNIESVNEVDRLKSESSLRIIPVAAHLADLLALVTTIFHTGDPDERLIPVLHGGGGQAAFRNALQRAGELADVDLSSLMTVAEPDAVNRLPHPHDARKAFASLLGLAGIDPDTRKKLLGHAPDDDIHERVYLVDHPDMRQRIEAIDALQALLAKALPAGLAIPTTRKVTTGTQGFTGERRLQIDADVREVGWVVPCTDGAHHGLLFSDDIAARAGVRVGTARRWLREGYLPSVRVDCGDRHRYGATPNDVTALLAALDGGKTLMQLADELGEDANTLRQRIHAQKLDVITIGRVMIIPESTERAVRDQVQRFAYLARHWIPLAEAAQRANVATAVVASWISAGELPLAAGRGQRRYVDPTVLQELASRMPSADPRYRRR